MIIVLCHCNKKEEEVSIKTSHFLHCPDATYLLIVLTTAHRIENLVVEYLN